MLFYPKEKYCINGAKLIVSILFLFIATFSNAQKEASIWQVGSGIQFNFQSGNFKISTFEGNNSANSTICDKQGNLVLYSNGRTIWNRNNEIVVNGEGLISDATFQKNLPVFVPYPKKDGWYILIYDEDYRTDKNGIYNNTIYYAEIDANANGGNGEVVRKKIKIHDNYHSTPSIASFCDNSYYWLVIDRNDNVINYSRDRIYFYKIDENGVNLTPKINDDLDIGSSGDYKFSPNGDKFYFMIGGNSVEQEIISDFNFKTGEMYNTRNIGDLRYSPKEFSPNSRLLYFFSKEYLIQLDVGYSSSLSIKNSADTILTLASNTNNVNPGGDLQLAPDGKIYFTYFDIKDGKTKLGAINEPNNKGYASVPETDIYTITFNNFRLPEFVTSFFRDKYSDRMYEVFPNAGPDVELCANSSTTIGVDENAKAFYLWSPDTGIDNPFTAKTVYHPTQKYNVSPQTSAFVLRATDGNCWVNFDTINITILPYPVKLPIDGNWSVCPFVEEADYWTVADKNNKHWLVNGGKIVTNPSNDSIKINWGETNMNASVSVFSTNEYGCSSDTSVFPVRINVKLITETPKGKSQLCIAENKNISYQIRKTNGSVYNWVADRGEVALGQGTNQVVVNWTGDGPHKLTVEETSTTIDTICFGASEPLIVNILNDSLEIKLENVSYELDNKLAIHYSSNKLRNGVHSLFLNIQDEFGTIAESNIFSQFDGKFIYTPITPELNTELISLKVINSCNETFYSNSLQTIVLHGIETASENSIRLNWNINQFWANDRLEHEIWYSENGQDNWVLVAGGEPGTEFNFPLKGLSLSHYFRIKEMNRDENLESWSNTIEIQIKGDLTIPDVFTPNGDGINDYWQIGNIRLHPFQKIMIYNKYGQVIYECNTEFIPWDGRINGKVVQGTYFYQIIFDSKSKQYGQVTVLQ